MIHSQSYDPLSHSPHKPKEQKEILKAPLWEQKEILIGIDLELLFGRR